MKRKTKSKHRFCVHYIVHAHNTKNHKLNLMGEASKDRETKERLCHGTYFGTTNLFHMDSIRKNYQYR